MAFYTSVHMVVGIRSDEERQKRYWQAIMILRTPHTDTPSNVFSILRPPLPRYNMLTQHESLVHANRRQATTLVMDEADMLMEGSYKKQLDDILVAFRRADRVMVEKDSLVDGKIRMRGIDKTQYGELFFSCVSRNFAKDASITRETGGGGGTRE